MARRRPGQRKRERKNGKRNGKGKGTEKEEEARPVFVEKRSSHFIRFDKSEAAVRIEPQKSTSFKIMSRNPFIFDASSIDRADTIPFRQDDEEIWPEEPIDTNTSCMDQIESFMKMVDDDNLSKWQAENKKLRSQKTLLENIIKKYILAPVQDQYGGTFTAEEVFERWCFETSNVGNTTSWHNPLAENVFDLTFAEMPFEQQELSLAILENDQLKSTIAELQAFFDECVFAPPTHSAHRSRSSNQQKEPESSANQPLDRVSLAKRYRELFEEHDETALKRSAQESKNEKTREDFVNNLRMENIQLKADNEQLENKLKDTMDFARDIGSRMKTLMKQSQEKFDKMSSQVEGAFEKINILKIKKSKPKKNRWLKVFSRKKKDPRDH